MASASQIIKRAREELGLTQQVMADRMGMTLRSYQRLEDGAFPKYKKENIETIDRILGTHVYDIIYDKVPREKSKKGKPLKSGFGNGEPPPGLNSLGTPIYEAGLMIKDKEVVLHEYQTEGPDFFVQIPQYRDCDYGTRAQGDRMYPEIRNGDLLICKSIDMDMVMYGDIYVLEVKGRIQTCSYVHQSENEEYYLLKARHEKIPDTVIEKSKITRIWKVRAVFKGL